MFDGLRFCLFITLVCASGLCASQGQPASGTSDIDSYIENALADWSVPGAAVAVVKDSRVVLAKGYGLLELGRPERVTEHSLFGLGSISKTFTTATVARLIDQGRLSWDDKLVDHLPEFRLHDPWVTANVTLRDAFTHRVGLDEIENNLPWLLGTLSRKEYVSRLRGLQLRYPFRDSFNYSNGMVDTVGELIGAVTGERWEDHVAHSIFQTLGMTRTVSGRDELVAPENLAPSWTGRAPETAVRGRAGLRPNVIDVAAPHGFDRNGKMSLYSWHHEQMNAPAGGVTSSAHDMTLFMLAHLSGKSASGAVFLRPETLSQIFSLQMAGRATAHMASEHDTNGRVQSQGMGIGWFVQTYGGRKMLEHGGGQIGYSTEVALIPAENLGVAVLLNEHYFDEHSFIARPLVTAILYRLLDRELGLASIDWSKRFHEEWRRDKQAAEQRINTYLQRLATAPQLALDDYVGLYRHPVNGTLEVGRDGSGLKFAFDPLISGRLIHETGNLFRLEFENEHYHTRAFAIVFPTEPSRPANTLALKVALDGTDNFYPIDWVYSRVPSKQAR
jgi:CubicO group peptidase (beta-lactamase class C family)